MLVNLYFHVQKNVIKPLSYTKCKINSKWINNSTRSEVINFQEENIGKKLLDNGLGNNFGKTQAIKAGIDKWDNINLKSFCLAKETTK